MLKNVNDVPAGKVKMNNGFLNRRLSKIQEDERHAIDTSIETIYLLRIIVANVNGMLANGINLRGIIQLEDYLRTRGDKVDFVKLREVACQAPHPAHRPAGRKRAHHLLRF